MRRRTPHCYFIGELQKRLLSRLAELDTVLLAKHLEPFVTPERSARFQRVFAARMRQVTVLMDSPYDPHNGAAVIRSCDAFGMQEMHILERGESFLAANTVSRGSERWVDVRTYTKCETAVATLERAGYELIATHPNGELLPGDLTEVPRLALVLGNERDGIHPELAKACKRSVRIPMRGFAESLNVSVTAAILLERATEGRSGDLTEDERNMLYARALVLTVPHASEILAAKGMSVDLPEGLRGEPHGVLLPGG